HFRRPAVEKDGEAFVSGKIRPQGGRVADSVDIHSPDPAGSGAAVSAAATGLTQAVAGEFIRIPLPTLRLDTYTDFDLYLRLRNTNEYVLYRNANLIFTERHRDRLHQNSVTDVFIRASERGHYVRYLESRLDEIIADQNLTPVETSRIVYECSTQLVNEVISQPWLGENIKRARGLICGTVDHLLRGAGQLHAMISIMSSDYRTYTHCVNVCVFGVALGQRIGFSVRELHELGVGLLFHDVGKAEIDSRILNKPGPLDADEWVIMKTHPERGVAILQGSEYASPNALCAIGQHHEKCSGQGYPRGLRSQEIHLFAKIASLADVFDALTTNRPYRLAMDSFPALRLMQEEMREDFNPMLFQELIQLLGSRDDPAQVPDERPGDLSQMSSAA
ncbi:MAG: HD-GYP domain-containing protein, partial [Candidatus Eisenbacteria bacterium]